MPKPSTADRTQSDEGIVLTWTLMGKRGIVQESARTPSNTWVGQPLALGSREPDVRLCERLRRRYGVNEALLETNDGSSSIASGLAAATYSALVADTQWPGLALAQRREDWVRHFRPNRDRLAVAAEAVSWRQLIS
jgi:hypothetical protein